MSYTKIQRLKKELDRAVAENDFELALESVNDMIKQDHGNDQYWNSRGVILSKLGRVEESIQAFDQALELNQGESRIWYSKGCVLMDAGKPRPALACFYKSLDLEPAFDKAKDRFNRCLDDLALYNQSQGDDLTDEEELSKEEEGEEEVEEEEEAPEILEPKAMKKEGTYLDDDMFGREVEDEEEDERDDIGEIEEDWGEEDEENDEDLDDIAEDWGEDDEGEEEIEYLHCRCGNKIWIETDERPFRFKCDECGREGTLK